MTTRTASCHCGHFVSRLKVSRVLSASAIALLVSKERVASFPRWRAFLRHTGSSARPQSTSAPVIKVPSLDSASAQCAEQPSSIRKRVSLVVLGWPSGHSPIPAFRLLATRSTIAGDIHGSNYRRVQLHSRKIHSESSASKRTVLLQRPQHFQ